MNSLSDAFSELAASDERSFAGATPGDGLLRRARTARARTRAFQTVGGALALGGVGLTAVYASDLTDATVPLSTASATPSSTAEPSPTGGSTPPAPGPGATTGVKLDTWGYQSIETLGMFGDAFKCGADAPKPSTGRVRAEVSDVLIRPTEWVWSLDEQTPLVDEDGYTSDQVIADTSVWAADEPLLAADIPATLIIFARDDKIVGMAAPGRVNPREPVRTIDTPKHGTTQVVEYGTHALLTDEPTTFTTGYWGWGCPEHFGDSAASPETTTFVYPPASDYFEPGAYDVYLVARVVVNKDTAAEHAALEHGMDLWRDFDIAKQAKALGWESNKKKVSSVDGTFTHVIVTVPVPDPYLEAETMDAFIVSEAITVTMP